MPSPSPPPPRPLSILGYLSHLSRIELFSSPSCYLLVGSKEQQGDRRKRRGEEGGEYRVLRVLRSEGGEGEGTDLRIVPDAEEYSQSALELLLRSLSPVTSLCVSFGLVGTIKFLDCYYITLITRRQKVGQVGGEPVYSIKSTEMVPLRGCIEGERAPEGEGEGGEEGGRRGELGGEGGAPTGGVISSLIHLTKQTVGLGLSQAEIEELRYHGLFNSIDLTKNFLFSYTYDLTNTLQHNILVHNSQPYPPPPPKDMYAWNHYQTRELEASTGAASFHWCLPIVFGAFLQRKVLLAGRETTITLIARRSRHFAGTRYLKRGVSDVGKVANDVEHEQVVFAADSSSEAGTYSSYVQVRGSIPIYWTQESLFTMPKPPIVLNRVDPTYKATQLHFSDLMARYGGPVVVLDLVKQSEKREREVIVGNEFRHAIEHLNSFIDDEHKVRYCALDYSHISKHRTLNVSKALDEVAVWAVNKTSFFCSKPKYRIDSTGKVKDFWDIGAAESDDEREPTATGNSVEEESKQSSPNSNGGSSEASAHDDRTSGGDATALATAPSSPPPPPNSSFSSPPPSPSKAHPATPAALAPAQRFAPHSVRYHLGVPILPMEQRGVLRTNCIDCLDRTNVAQFSAGVTALAQQLVVMGIQTTTELDPTSQVVHVLMDMYSEIGDYIALQYGGSEAHKKVASAGASSTSQGSGAPSIGKHKEFLTSVRRYYSNTFTDRMKQDAMNLFLGYFVPAQSSVPMWELENDYYLHNFHVQTGFTESMVDFRLNKVGYKEDDDDDNDNDDFGGESESGGGQQRQQQQKLAEEDEEARQRQTVAERTLRVRRRCKRQDDQLSSWWRKAVQSYHLQRMWMKLDQPAETRLPAQFERLYQPHQLTQFDTYFAHAWAAPSRAGSGYTNSIAADKGQLRQPGFGAVDDDDATVGSTPSAMSTAATTTATTTTAAAAAVATAGSFSRSGNRHRDSTTTVLSTAASASTSTSTPTPANAAPGGVVSAAGSGVTTMVRKFGKGLSNAKSMLSLKPSGNLEHRGGGAASDELLGEVSNGMYIEGEDEALRAASEYAQYVKYAEDPGLLEDVWSDKAYEEFTKSLADVNLPPDAVDGIRKLAESAHITREIQKGPYEGLLQDTSAHEVAKLVREQLDVLGSSASRGAEEDGARLVKATLRRSGMGGSAVSDTVAATWDELKRSSLVHASALDESLIKKMQSTLTSEESIHKYRSYFPQEGEDFLELLREKQEVEDKRVREEEKEKEKEKEQMKTKRKSKETTAAAAEGAGGDGSGCLLSGTPDSLFGSKNVAESPKKLQVALEGFEFVSADLYARTDNKFMVVNGAGMGDWTVSHRTKMIEADAYFDKVFKHN